MNKKQKKLQIKKAKDHQEQQKAKPPVPKGVTIGVPTASADSR